MISYTAIATLFLVVTVQTPKAWHASSNLEDITHSLSNQPSGKYILNCGTWGCYFGSSLFMQNTPVTWAETNGQRLELLETAKNTRRSIIHLCHNCQESEVQKLYEGSPVSLYQRQKSDFGEWSAFKVN